MIAVVKLMQFRTLKTGTFEIVGFESSFYKEEMVGSDASEEETVFQMAQDEWLNTLSF